MKKMKRIVVAVLSMCMLLSTTLTVHADNSASEAVMAAAKGVVQIWLTYTDQNNVEWVIQSGSGFLISGEAGPDTIVTNNHVVSMDAETQKLTKDTFGREIVNDLEVRVVVDRDLTRKATLTELNSKQYDIAVLKLEEPMYGTETLKINTEENLSKTQKVFALGFPDMAQLNKDKVFYTSDDVTITSGTISDITEIEQTKHIQHECILSSGNSGGPLVNEAGEVIGVNRASLNNTYYYSVMGSELVKLLDKYGIKYNVGTGGTIVDPGEPEKETVDTSELSALISKAKAKDLKKYTEDSVSYFKAALKDAEKVLDNVDSDQAAIDGAVSDLTSADEDLKEKSGIPVWVYAAGGAAVLIIIIVIVMVIAKSKKKPAPQLQSNPIPNNMNIPQPAPQAQPMPAGQVPPMRPNFSDGAGETSVLNEGAGQTTVLSAQMVPTATIKRVANGESGIINKNGYKLGKERSRVDFCVANNNSISRVHAEITYENGAFYITDNNATNFTFVNGNKVNSGQKMKLSSGDRIKLSDEEFEFKA